MRLALARAASAPVSALAPAHRHLRQLLAGLLLTERDLELELVQALLELEQRVNRLLSNQLH